MFQKMEQRIADQISARIEEAIHQRMQEVDTASQKSIATFNKMHQSFSVVAEQIPRLRDAVVNYYTVMEEATGQLEQALEEGKRIEQLQNEVTKLQKIVRQKEKQLRMLGRGE